MSITTQDLVDERGRVLAQIDDILNTATGAGRGLTDIEDAEHRALAARSNSLDELITRSRGNEHPGGAPIPMANIVGNDTRAAAYGLDALLWATAERVAAGTFDRQGGLMPNPNGATNPVDAVVVRSESLGLTIEAPRIDDIAPNAQRAVRNFQQMVADMALWGLLVDNSARSSRDGFEAARPNHLWRDRWNTALRALDVDTTAEGGTWVPTGIGASMHEKVRAAGKIAPLFARIDLPTNPWKWPVEGADAIAYRVDEPTSDSATKVTPSTPGTIAPTFDAEIFGARTLFSRSVEADSAMAIVPFVQKKLVQAFVDAEEQAILDGDADLTHQDTDTHALGATSASWAWDGLRKKALAQTTQATTTTTVANLGLIRKSMGKWGINPSDLVFIVGVSAMHTLLTDSSLLTFDKMGPQAVILNGQIGSVYGVPVIVSEHVRENLNASGVHDAITTTKTYNLCVNRNEWAMGSRMALDLQVDDSIYRESFQRVLVGFCREDFQSLAGAATNEDTSIGYNVTP